MTAVGVFSGFNGSTVHLIADTLTTDERPSQEATHLTTQLVLDPEDQKEYTFSEGTLKLGIFQNNLAIGYAGVLGAGNAPRTYGHRRRLFRRAAIP